MGLMLAQTTYISLQSVFSHEIYLAYLRDTDVNKICALHRFA